MIDLVEGYEFVEGMGVMEEVRPRSMPNILKLGNDQRRCDFCHVQKCGIF